MLKTIFFYFFGSHFYITLKGLRFLFVLPLLLLHVKSKK